MRIIRLSRLLLEMKMVPSIAEAKRLIKQGAVEVGGKKVIIDVVELK